MKRDIYFFLWKGKRIVMIPSEEQKHVPITEVKNDKKLLKIKVVEEHVKDIKEL